LLDAPIKAPAWRNLWFFRHGTSAPGYISHETEWEAKAMAGEVVARVLQPNEHGEMHPIQIPGLFE